MYTRRGHCIAQSRNRKINRFRPRIKKKKKKQRSEILNNATETGLLKETKKKKKNHAIDKIGGLRWFSGGFEIIYRV